MIGDHPHVQEDVQARERMNVKALEHRVADLERGELAMRARIRELERQYADLIKTMTEEKT